MNRYLIPSNSKRSMLILGLFTPVDLIIIGVGGVLTAILLFTFRVENLKDIFTVMTPAIISFLMVLPVPNHHNLWQFTANIYNFFSKRRTYYWKGWCVINEENGSKEQ